MIETLILIYKIHREIAMAVVGLAQFLYVAKLPFDDVMLDQWGYRLYWMGPLWLALGAFISIFSRRLIMRLAVWASVGALVAFPIALFNGHAGQSLAFVLLALCTAGLGAGMTSD